MFIDDSLMVVDLSVEIASILGYANDVIAGIDWQKVWDWAMRLLSLPIIFDIFCVVRRPVLTTARQHQSVIRCIRFTPTIFGVWRFSVFSVWSDRRPVLTTFREYQSLRVQAVLD